MWGAMYVPSLVLAAAWLYVRRGVSQLDRWEAIADRNRRNDRWF